MPRTLLFLDHAPAIGGAEQSLLLLLSHLDRGQWSPHLVCVDGPLADRAAEFDVPVHRIEFPRLRRSAQAGRDLASTALAIAEIARDVDARLLHANTMRAAFYAAPASRIARRPFVWHMRDFWLSENRPRMLWLDQLGKSALCSAAAVVIANSHAVARHLPSREQIAVVHNGINTLTFGPTGCGDPFRHPHGIPDSVPLVGMVGRLRPWKGQERFLRMAATVAETQPDVHFVLVGDDPFSVQDAYAKRLRALSAELGLHSRLTFTGHLEDVRPAFAAMDVFVHPGDPEPFGLVNIEAMAMEKPVVALAHGALPEIVDHGRTGLLVSPVDGTDLARSVRILLNEPAYARCLGRAGRQRAVEHFDVRMTARRIEQVFRRLTGGQL